MHKYDLIIFDCDGTLVDTEGLCNTALVEIVNGLGLHQYDLAYALKHWAGMTISDVLLQIQMETGFEFPADTPQQYVRRVQQMYKDGLPPMRGALDFVAQVAPNFKICVGSNGQRDNVIESLSLSGFVPHYFTPERIFTRIQVPQGKPAPDLFLFAAEKMGVMPERCLVIEDSPFGVMAARAAGMDAWGFISVPDGDENHYKQLEKAGAEKIFTDFIHMGEMLTT